jgi:signal transduction histidine kinase
MLISIFFSVIIYSIVNGDLKRIEKFHNKRQQEERENMRPYVDEFRNYRKQNPNLPSLSKLQKYSPEIIYQVRTGLQWKLLIINGGIFFLSGVAGYFLAGRTLKPIEKMVEDQKRFIADASHELRTPLTSLRTAMEVDIRDKDQPEKIKKALVNYLEDVINLQTLSDRLLRLYSIEENAEFGDKGCIKSISLIKVLNSAKKNISVMLKNKNIRLNSNIEKKVVLAVDEGDLVELFTILLDNAIKYSEDNAEINVTSQVLDKNKIKISIQDFGIGITEAEIRHIFDRFYRSDLARAKNGVGGYGLGLSIAKKIAELNCGNILVESEIDKGSVFSVVLCCREDDNK